MSQILLVEDDFAIGQGIQVYLESMADHKVTWVKYGKDAQAALSKGHAYDCVLLDLTLPDVQGLEILKTLRTHDQTTPVIIITANDFPDVRTQCAEAGATDFLGKMFKPAELVKRINTCLG
ncbi:MAG: response regulator [Gammaproteobacteria bacterium]